MSSESLSDGFANAKGDRIAVIYRGEFVAILDVQTATVEEIGLLMAGGTQRREA